MNYHELETAFAAVLTGFVFLAFTLTVVFYTIHKDIIRHKADAAVPEGHASSSDALSLALLPLELNGERLWISPSTGPRRVRYGLAEPGLMAEGDTMSAAVQGMLGNPAFRARKELDDRETARRIEIDA